jgi:hypothetical protein
LQLASSPAQDEDVVQVGEDEVIRSEVKRKFEKKGRTAREKNRSPKGSPCPTPEEDLMTIGDPSPEFMKRSLSNSYAHLAALRKSGANVLIPFAISS